MTTQKGAQKKNPVGDATREIARETETIVPAEILLEDLGLSTRVSQVLANAGLRTAQDILDSLAQGEAAFLAISGVGEKTLEQVRKRLAEKGISGSANDGDQERQTQRVENPLTNEPERALAESKNAAGGENMKAQLPSTAPGSEGAEQRVSFVVRLTVDEHGETRRTEIEHAQSGKKQAFPALDAQQLTAFMESCVKSVAVPEPAAPATSAVVMAEAAAAKTSSPEPAGPANSLTILDVRVSQTPDPEEPSKVRVQFRLRGPDAPSLAAQESPIQVQIFANDVASGTRTLLATHESNLVKGITEYSVEEPVPELSTGLHSLLTIVTLQGPINVLGYYEGPIINVTEVRSSAEFTGQPEAALAL